MQTGMSNTEKPILLQNNNDFNNSKVFEFGKLFGIGSVVTPFVASLNSLLIVIFIVATIVIIIIWALFMRDEQASGNARGFQTALIVVGAVFAFFVVVGITASVNIKKSKTSIEKR
jgi:hypothetical protein